MHFSHIHHAVLFVFKTPNLEFSFSFNCREYVVDLVRNPGRVFAPDSSINGKLLWSVPSPFQASHLLGSQNSCMIDSSWVHVLFQEQSDALLANNNNKFPGMHFHFLWSA